MTQYYTNFSEYIVGSPPGDWTERWNVANGSMNIVDDSGNVLQLSISTPSRYGVSWDTPGIAISNGEILVKIKFTVGGNDDVFRIMARCSGTGSVPTGYMVYANDTGNAMLVGYYSAGTTFHQIDSYSMAITAGTYYWIRFRVEGTSIKVKVWLDGNSEPGVWNGEYTDSHVTGPGWFGLGAYYNTHPTADSFQFDNLVITIPVVSTYSATDVLSTSAVGNGEVISDGGSTIVQRGFVWSTSVNPTTADNKIIISGDVGVFSGSLTGLNRLTTYHVRAFASNEAGTAYGADVQFATLAELPTVTTSDATAVTAVSATGHGNVTDDGGDVIVERGFVYSLVVNPTIVDSKVVVSGTTGAFSGSIIGLFTGVTYHYRAYATNSIGTAYGADYTISTVISLPTVITSPVTDIGSSAATANGDVVDAGGGTILERGFAWGTAPNPTITADNKVVVSGALGVFTGPLVGLTSNVLYHVRAYAINEAGIAYGADVFFTSLESGMGGGGGGAGGAEPVAVGTVYSPDDEAGVVYAVDVTTGNLLLFYKKIDPLPYSATDSAKWNDGFDLPYTASALALALSAEDDEYDRYRAWIYEFISNSVADSLRNMAINKNVR